MWFIKTAPLVLLLEVAIAQDSEAEAIAYLTQYGYVKENEFVDVDTLSDAVKEFQDFAGLKKTGKIDKETQELMQAPRCGVKDKLSNFIIHGSRWPKKDLTYRISKYPKNRRSLSKRDVESKTREALAMWQDASSLTFSEKSSGSVDIDIGFEEYGHGDGNSFDGRGGVLAHAFFPQFGGSAHFDDSENWSVTPFQGNQLLNTLTHELGHSLGLRHSNVRGSIMAPFYKGWDTNLKLEDDDRRGIQSLYGPSSGPTPVKPTQRPTRRTTTIRSINFPTRRHKTFTPSNPTIGTKKLCQSKIDAIVKTSDETSYVFKGDDYWKMTDDNVASGYPRRISQDWPGLPGNIDAAFTWQSTKYTYFFKGDKYWKFQNKSPSEGYPKDIAIWNGLPTDMDAALEWGRNGKLYFFKGSQYWKYDTTLNKTPDEYPKDISVWQNIPNNVDTALQWSNGKTYFFKSGNYWRFNDDTLAVDRSNPGFPRDAGEWWFGCPKRRLNIPFVDATDEGFNEEVDTEH